VLVPLASVAFLRARVRRWGCVLCAPCLYMSEERRCSLCCAVLWRRPLLKAKEALICPEGARACARFAGLICPSVCLCVLNNGSNTTASFT
jgi:hypothetical protein